MDLLTAHGRFALRYDGGEYTPFAGIEYEPVDDDLQPLMMVAAASLSGQLDDCLDDDDLDDAVRHFLSLFNSEVFTLAQWQAEIMRCFDELAAWAEAAECN
ncbi:MAG: hypothetical protein HYV60_17145 [Planctomycetia bacterium]|nr:hypothetical protein [Planctomycetia bacterium]